MGRENWVSGPPEGFLMVAIFTGLGLGTERGSNFVLGSQGQLGSSVFGRYGENVYVNAANGNLAIQRTDEVLTGIGADLPLARSYNSQGLLSDDNGDNWRLNASRKVAGLTGTVNTAGSTVIRTDWDGSDTTYTWDATRNAYVCKQGDGAYDTLTFASATWTWTDGNAGATESYADASGGRITTSKDANGNSTTFTYGATGLLTKVALPDGGYVSLTYSGNNLTKVATYGKATSTSAVALMLTRVSYTYDTSNRLSTVTTDLSPTDSAVTDGRIVKTTYTYDGTSKRVASISQTGGARLDITYVLVGTDYRVASFTQAQSSTASSTTSFLYDVANKTTTIIDNTGQQTRLTYDDQGQLTKLEQSPSVLAWTPQLNQWISNGNGSFTAQAGASSGSVLSAVTYSQAEVSAQLTSSTNAVAISLYDPVSGKAWDIYAYGSDSSGNGHILLGNIYFPLGSGPGGATDITNIDTGATFAAGDTLSLRWVNGALHGFKGNSDLGAVPNGPSASTSLKLLLLGFQNGATLQNVVLSRSAAAVPGPQVSTFTYNSNGDVTSASDPLGKITAYSYDGNGNRTFVQDAIGNTVTYTYDGANHRLTETHYLAPDPDGAGVGTYGQPVTTRYAYDAKGNIRYLMTPDGRVTQYNYGADGALQSELVFAANYYDTSALGTTDAVSAATMDAWAGGITDKSGCQLTEFSYDYRGNLSIKTRYSAVSASGAGISASAVAANFTYDQAGNLLGMTQGNVSYTYAYDGLNRITTEFDQDRAWLNTYYSDGSNSYWVTDSDRNQTTVTMDLAGEVVSRQRLGVSLGGTLLSTTTAYAYDSLGQLRMTTDALSHKTYYLYDHAGRKVADIAADGSLTEYVYDADNRLTATIGYANKLSGAQLASLVDAQGKPAAVELASIRPAANALDRCAWSVYDAAGRLVESIGPAGNATVYNYDGASRLVATTRYYNALDVSGFRSSPPTTLQLPTANAKDDLTRDFYDEDGHLVGTLDAGGALTQFSYDAAGQKIRAVAYANPVASNIRVTGSFAQLVASAGTNAKDNRTDYVYDDMGQLTFTIDANGSPTGFVYDAAGHVIQTTAYAGSIAVAASYSLAYVQSQLASTGLNANSANRVSHAVYNGVGKLEFSIDAAGTVTQLLYDAALNVVKQVVFAATDPRNGDYSSATWESWATANASAANQITRTLYDPLERPFYSVDAEGYVSQTQRDLVGNITKTIRYAARYTVTDSTTTDNLTTTIGSPSDAAITAYTYDVDGRVDTITDAESIVTKYLYDTFGRVTDTIAAFGTSDAATTHTSYDAAGRIDTTTDPAAIVTKYAYDAFGRVTDATIAYGTSDAATTHTVYDILGRASSVTRAYGTSAAAAIAYSYDAFGNVHTVTDPDNNITVNDYDQLDRLLSVTDPTNALTAYQYDAFGNRVKTTDARGNASFDYYDKLGRLELSVDAEGYATATSYTAGGAISSVTHYNNKVSGNYSVGVRPTITPSAKDELTKFTRDKLDRVTDVTDAMNKTEHYQLDSLGNRVQLTNKLGGVVTYQYDRRGLLKQETKNQSSSKADGSIVANSVVTTYTYDARRNLKTTVEAAGLSEQRTTKYYYDLLDRLIRKEGDAFNALNADGISTTSTVPTENYGYDLRGNVVEHNTGPAGARTLTYYDAADRKIAELDPVGRLTKYTNDANGNVKAIDVYGDSVALPAIAGGTPPAPVDSNNVRHTEYAYDKNDRLIATTNHSVFVGENTGTYQTHPLQDVQSLATYDANGNVIKQTSPRKDFYGQEIATYSFYDKNNHKIAEVNEGSYFTTWTRDADGNVLTETRYANRLTMAVDQNSDINSMIQNAGSSPDDRITTFEYDQNGNRTSESRLNVESYTLDATTHQPTKAVVTSRIDYWYNALGLVTHKTEANGDYTDYGFDQFGRMTQIRKSGFTDNNVTYTPTTDMGYDGLDHLVRQVVRGDTGADNRNTSADRITKYAYDTAGRVVSSIDANNFETKSSYDIAGHLAGQTYQRLKSDGSSVSEGALYSYDLAGRQTHVSKVMWNGASWTTVQSSDMRYNAYGDMIARGVNTGNDPSKFQEFADYDNVGRVWRTNFGDGVTKAYVYDAGGNATLLIESTGQTDLRTLRIDEMLARSDSGQVALTQSIYNNRNQLRRTIQPSIANAANLPGGINHFDATNSGNIAGSINIDAPGAAYPYLDGTTPATNGSAALAAAGSVVAQVNNFSGSYVTQVTLTLGAGYSGRIYCADGAGSVVYGSTDFTVPGTSSIYDNITAGNSRKYYIWQDYNGVKRIIGSVGPVSSTNTRATSSTYAMFEFDNVPSNATQLVLFARAAGTDGPYQRVATQKATNPANGTFTVDPSAAPFNGMPASKSWNIVYYAMDSSGTTVECSMGTINTDPQASPSASLAHKNIGGSGKQILTREGSSDYLVLTQTPAGYSASVQFRQNGGAWSAGVSPSSLPYSLAGVSAVDLSGKTGAYDYLITYTNGGSKYQVQGSFAIGSAQPQPLTTTGATDQLVHWTFPQGGTSLTVMLRPSGNSGPYQSGFATYNSGAGRWDFNTAAAFSAFGLNTSGTTQWQFQTQLYSGGTLVNQSSGVLQLGPSAFVVSNVVPAAGINLVLPGAAKAVINYRPAGSIGAYTVLTIPRDGNGNIFWNAEGLVSSGTVSYEYLIDTYDSSGNLLASGTGDRHRTGYIDVYSNRTVSTRTLSWTLTSPPDPAATIIRNQAYNAFGEIISETDGRGDETDLHYNTMGRLTQKQAPQVSYTKEDGTTASARPTENYYYDIVGRLIGTQDANGNTNEMALLANSGEGDGEDAITINEYHADNGIKKYHVNIFGDVVRITNELNLTDALAPDIFNSYDNMGRLIGVTRADGSVTTYAYDGLGERIGHTVALSATAGAPSYSETADYDVLGRVVATKDLAGRLTSYSYGWNSAIVATGSGVVGGGWQKITTDAAGVSSSENSDTFGRTVWRQDFGGKTLLYTFDLAGRLIQQNSNSQNILFSYYGNGYIKSVQDAISGTLATYEYDNDGNRTVETYTSTVGGNTTVLTDTRVEYDAMNRVSKLHAKLADISYEYDLNSNRRRVLSSYNDGVGGYQRSEDYWYKYDTMNRFTLTMGTLQGGQIVQGSYGVLIGYDAANERVSATSIVNGTQSQETYTYTFDGYLKDTTINGVVRASRTNDSLGRVTSYSEYDASHTLTYSQTTQLYDGDNRAIDQTLQQLSGGSLVTTNIHNDYRAEVGVGTGNYSGADQGVITHSKQMQGTSVTQETVYTYQWRDQAQALTIGVRRSGTGSYSLTDQAASQFTYDQNGHVLTVTSNGGANGTRYLTNDAYGQVLAREDRSGNQLSVFERYIYLNGNRMGEYGNNGPSRVDYATALAQRGVGSVGIGQFRAGHPVSSADFDENYEPIGPNYPGQAASQYTVHGGDTLSSIAQALWGDSSMWYLIADANGLKADSNLVAGQILLIPNKVTNIHNRAGVYRVYDPGEAIGDAMPLLPVLAAPPPAHHHGGCGVVGEILLIAVAVAVTAALPEIAGTYFGAGGLLGGGILEGAVTGAIASTASQIVGVATGIQDHFSFKGVALAAIAGGVGGGIGSSDFDKTLNASKFVTGAANGALSNVLTQGIAVAAGLQSHFNWAGVAAAGVTGGVMRSIQASGAQGVERYVKQGLSGSAAAIAGAATRSLLTGTDFGDNVLNALPDVIGQTIGNAVGDKIVAVGERAHYENMSPEEIFEEKRDEVYGGIERKYGKDAADKAIQGLEPQIRADARGTRKAIDQGVSLSDPEALRAMHGTVAELPASGDESVVTGTVTFGDRAAQAGLTTQGWIQDHPNWAAAANYGVVLLKGGPVGLVTDYAVNKVLSAGLAATGLDRDITSAADTVGAQILGFLHSGQIGGESFANEQALAQSQAVQGNTSARTIVGFAGTVLGVASLAGLTKLAVGRAAAAESEVAGSASLWARAEVNGTRVYQRSDLIDAGTVDSLGRTNLQRMESGLAPLGPDGKSINLHHMLQSNDGPLAEVTQTFHQKYSSTIHINPNTTPSGIDRRAFDAWRRSYWQTRAGDFRQ